MRRPIVTAAALSGALVLGLAGWGSAPASGKAFHPNNRFAPSGTVSVDPFAHPARLDLHQVQHRIPPSTTGSGGCVDSSSTNVRANQECTNQSAPGFFGRSQSQNETGVAVDPTNPRNVLISQNDYRLGDSKCGADWSRDGGRHWGSQIAPSDFTPGFTAPRHYWDAAGDTSVAFDSSGEAYLTCLIFDRGATSDANTNASGFVLFRSADKGASWSFPGSFIARSDGSGADGIGLLDKPYIAVDLNAHGRFLDRLYVAWVQYNVDFTKAPIYFAYSKDHGVSWHQTGEISGASATLCPVHFGVPGGDRKQDETDCDANGFPEPFVAPNGDLYVVFDNYNNCAGVQGASCGDDPNDNHNQVLIVKSTDGGRHFGEPAKVADYYELPDCVTYTGQDFGVPCVPTAPLSGTSVFRAFNYPSAVALSDDQIVVDFASYINPHSNPSLGNCRPRGISPDTFLNRYRGVGRVNGCNNDILRSSSSDGGAHWTGQTVPPARLPAVSDENPGGPFADQWWQWSAGSRTGAVTSYFDRKYGSDRSSGFMDVTLASGPTSAGAGHTRVTDSSMPPSNEFPLANGYSGFLGDYTGLAVGSDGVAHPAWPDTRNPIMTFNPAGDARTPLFAGYGADIYTRSLPVA